MICIRCFISDMSVTLIVASSVFGSANLSLVLRLMRLALDVFGSNRMKFDAETLYAVTRDVLPKPLLLRCVVVKLFEMMSCGTLILSKINCATFCCSFIFIVFDCVVFKENDYFARIIAIYNPALNCYIT